MVRQSIWRLLGFRLWCSILGLGLVSLFAFWLAELAPGSAAEALLGSAGLASKEAVVHLEHDWGMDGSWMFRYGRWLAGFFSGDWGYSNVFEQALRPYLWGALGISVRLGLLSLGWMVLLGFGLGFCSVWQRGRLVDGVLRVVGLLGLSLPSFWLGLLGLVFSFRWFGVLPIYSTRVDFGLQEVLMWGLPSLIVGFRGAGLLQRITRASLLDAVEQDYWRTALAKGLSPRGVLLVHAVRNVLPSLVTVLGVEAAFMLGGLVVTETVFNFPGLGTALVHAVRWRDWSSVRTMLLLFTLLTLMINLLVDVINAFINPRLHGT